LPAAKPRDGEPKDFKAASPFAQMLARAAEHIRKAGSADFLPPLRLLPGGKSCKVSKPYGFVPHLPHMSPNAD